MTVRYLSRSVPLIDSPGQWSKFGRRVPLPSHFLQPIVLDFGHFALGAETREKETEISHQPCENQKVLCPLLHSLVPLVHELTFGSIVPVAGCLPWAHCGSSLSMAFLGGGMIMLP